MLHLYYDILFWVPFILMTYMYNKKQHLYLDYNASSLYHFELKDRLDFPKRVFEKCIYLGWFFSGIPWKEAFGYFEFLMRSRLFSFGKLSWLSWLDVISGETCKLFSRSGEWVIIWELVVGSFLSKIALIDRQFWLAFCNSFCFSFFCVFVMSY